MIWNSHVLSGVYRTVREGIEYAYTCDESNMDPPYRLLTVQRIWKALL